jgi:DNA end-binding protein Ku
MPRKLQSAAISFGLVTIPADLYTATSAESISFNQIHGECGSRIKQQLFCPVCNRVVERSELVKGYEISKGQYVQLTEADLEQLEAAQSQHIEIMQFLPLSAVDPIYFEKTYYLGAGKGGEKPYQLLRHAMEKRQQVALAKMVMRGKENLVLVRAAKDLLLLHFMYYADEVRDTAEIPKGNATTSEQELNLALQLIDALAEPNFQPDLYRDEYRERVLQMIQEKAEGKAMTVAPQAPTAPVLDLMSALKASLEKGPKKPRPTAKPARAEGPTGKKTAARK